MQIAYKFDDVSPFVQASLVAQRLKHLPAMQETRVRSLGWEYPLEKEMATHSSILAWRIPWMEEPGRLQSTGSQRVRQDWATSLSPSTAGKNSSWFFLSADDKTVNRLEQMQLHTGSLLLYTLYAITFSKVKNVANSMEINRKEHSQGSGLQRYNIFPFK